MSELTKAPPILPDDLAESWGVLREQMLRAMDGMERLLAEAGKDGEPALQVAVWLPIPLRENTSFLTFCPGAGAKIRTTDTLDKLRKGSIPSIGSSSSGRTPSVIRQRSKTPPKSNPLKNMQPVAK